MYLTNTRKYLLFDTFYANLKLNNFQFPHTYNEKYFLQVKDKQDLNNYFDTKYSKV